MLHRKKKRPQGSQGGPWKGKQSSRRCPQESPGTPREPLSPPESFPEGPQRVPAKAQLHHPQVSPKEPQSSQTAPQKAPRARSGRRFDQFCTHMLIKMIGSFETEKLRQKRQTSMLFGRPRVATRGRNRISRGKPLKGQTLENIDFLMVFVGYSDMLDFLGKSNSEATACVQDAQELHGNERKN